MDGKEAGPHLTLHPAFEQKVVHILVRWLLIILAFHFVALSRVDPREFAVATNVSYGFILSNLLLMAVPRRYFSPGWFVRGLIGVDFAFVALGLYFVREPGTQYPWLFILLLGLLGWRRNVRDVLIVLGTGLVITTLTMHAFRGRWLFFYDAGDFLRASILFAVACFYFYVIELLGRNARLFHIVERAKQEWERTADAMDEFIMLVDQHGRIQRVNRALAERLGKKPPELVEEFWYAVLDAGDAPRPESPLARMFAAAAPVHARFTHQALGLETQALAVPLFEGDLLAGALYILRA